MADMDTDTLSTVISQAIGVLTPTGGTVDQTPATSTGAGTSSGQSKGKGPASSKRFKANQTPTQGARNDPFEETRKRQTPAEVMEGVYEMVTGLAAVYKMLMGLQGLLSNKELTLIQNSHAMERIILASTDSKKTEYQLKKSTAENDGIDHTKTGAMFHRVKEENGIITFEPMRLTYNKEVVRQHYTQIMGKNAFNGLNHIMISQSNFNDVCYQRTKALKQVGLDSSLISTFSGSTLPRRSGATGNAVKGGGTLVAEAIRFIKRAQADRSMMRVVEVKAAYERLLVNLRRKCSAKAQQDVVTQVMSAKNPGMAEIEDLKILARSFLLVRPSVSSKAALTLGAYYAAVELKSITNKKYSLVGNECFMAFNSAPMITLLRQGDVIEDKAQLYTMASFGLAYEDLRVVSEMTGRKLKPRSALRAKGFHVPLKEVGSHPGANVMNLPFHYWAPLTVAGGNEASGGENSGQISLQPTFAVERPIAISKTAVRKMMSSDTEGRVGDVREGILALMNNALEAKNAIAFKGKPLYPILDSKKENPRPLNLPKDIPSFFFGRDNAEDYDDVVGQFA